MPRVEIDGQTRRVVLEGGAIDVNGKGTLLTTEECLLSDIQARNPGLDRAGIADRLCRHTWASRTSSGSARGLTATILMATSTIWPGSSTLIRSSRSSSRRESDPNYERLQDNRLRLSEARDQGGASLRVIPLPMPAPVIFEGQRLPASYANFYIANRLVLVPDVQRPQ